VCFRIAKHSKILQVAGTPEPGTSILTTLSVDMFLDLLFLWLV